MTEAPPTLPTRRSSLRAAALVLFVHGAIEVLGLGLLAAPPSALPPSLAERPLFWGLIAALYGSARLVAAVGVWAGRTWAVALGILCSGATLVVAPSIPPWGVLDLLFALPTLVLLLGVWFGNSSIE